MDLWADGNKFRAQTAQQVALLFVEQSLRVPTPLEDRPPVPNLVVKESHFAVCALHLRLDELFPDWGELVWTGLEDVQSPAVLRVRHPWSQGCRIHDYSLAVVRHRLVTHLREVVTNRRRSIQNFGGPIPQRHHHLVRRFDDVAERGRQVDHGLRVAVALLVVGVEQLWACEPLHHHPQLPSEVRRVTFTRVPPLPLPDGHQMCGVARDEHPALPEITGDPTVVGVSASADYVEVTRVRNMLAQQPVQKDGVVSNVVWFVLEQHELKPPDIHGKAKRHVRTLRVATQVNVGCP